MKTFREYLTEISKGLALRASQKATDKADRAWETMDSKTEKKRRRQQSKFVKYYRKKDGKGLARENN